MTIEVIDSDGTVIEFPDGMPQEQIAAIMRQRNQPPPPPGSTIGADVGRAPPPSSSPSWRPRGLADLVRGAPSQPYRRAYERRAQERAPQGAPGSFTRRLEEFNRSGPAGVMAQMWRNIGIADEAAGASTYLGQGTQNALRRLMGRRIEIPASEAADAAIDYERDQQQQVARDQPIVNVLSHVASVPAFGGTPVQAVARIPALRAGLAAAGINAPFALARQEGSLQERLPGAGLETAAVGGLGFGLQGVANRLLRPPGVGTTGARQRQFQRAGVRAPLAAVQGRGGAPMAMAIAENPIGGNVRRNLQASVDDVSAAAGRLTAQAGTPEPREIAGDVAQQAVRRFARARNAPRPAHQVRDRATGQMRPASARETPVRDWSFAAKANALYDDVFGRLAADEQAQIAGGIQGLLSTRATSTTLQNILTRVHGPQSRAAMQNTAIRDMAEAIRADARSGALRFQDLRAWRTWVREAQRNEGLRQGLDNASLQRLEAALTQDIYTSALRIGGHAAQDLRATDRWYRQITNRIQTALQPFDNASGGAQAFRRVIDLASQGGRQNTRQLTQLRASLRPDEWRTVSASIMDELGNPSFGAPHVMEPGAFSLEHFVTNVGRMSDDGRSILFGPQLADELENLGRVAGALKGVRGFTNYSRSGSSIQNISTLSAAGGAAVAAATGNIVPLAMLASAGLLARVTGEMLTNPAFVRWLTSTGSAGGQGMRRQMAALATIAARDPAVAPLYSELAQRGVDQFRARQEPQLDSIGRSQ